MNCIISSDNCSERVAAGSSNPQNWEVVVGEHSQAGYDGTEQILQIDYIVKHNAFSIESKYHTNKQVKLIIPLAILMEYSSKSLVISRCFTYLCRNTSITTIKCIEMFCIHTFDIFHDTF